jgi:hypothetical protein
MGNTSSPLPGFIMDRQDYEQRIAKLYSTSSAMPDRHEDLLIRRSELDLLIDYKLGESFPAERRDQMWEVKQRLDRWHWWYVVKGFVTSPTDPGAALARAHRASFIRVLSARELQQFLAD